MQQNLAFIAGLQSPDRARVGESPSMAQPVDPFAKWRLLTTPSEQFKETWQDESFQVWTSCCYALQTCTCSSDNGFIHAWVWDLTRGVQQKRDITK